MDAQILLACSDGPNVQIILDRPIKIERLPNTAPFLAPAPPLIDRWGPLVSHRRRCSSSSSRPLVAQVARDVNACTIRAGLTCLLHPLPDSGASPLVTTAPATAPTPSPTPCCRLLPPHAAPVRSSKKTATAHLVSQPSPHPIRRSTRSPSSTSLFPSCSPLSLSLSLAPSSP